MVGLNLHHDLSKHGISVQTLHPGMVATDLTNVIDPTDAALRRGHHRRNRRRRS